MSANVLSTRVEARRRINHRASGHLSGHRSHDSARGSFQATPGGHKAEVVLTIGGNADAVRCREA
eukprot:scaffold51627_cov26-Tisochrysis_lutea.AAC.1